MVIRYLIEKEFRQLKRNKFLPRLILIFPLLILLVFPWAADFEMKNINFELVDNDHSTYSAKLINKISSSGYFRLHGTAASYGQAMQSIESDRADVILEIPRNFEKDLVNTGHARVLIAANTVNGTKGGMSSYYLMGILNDFSSGIRDRMPAAFGVSLSPQAEIVPQFRYNPYLNYKVFMVPALMVMVITMLCGFLPALNIVMEKEAGTMEQINVTPVSRFLFILGKLLPFWIIGFVVITLGFGVAYLVYGLYPVGSFGTIYFFAAIYILAVSGFGLIISNYSETMQQAMFVIFFFMLIFIILSGLFTPIKSMPIWAQYITDFNPLKYFMQVMRMVYLKGSGIAEMRTQLFALLAFAAVFNSWAVISYRKRV